MKLQHSESGNALFTFLRKLKCARINDFLLEMAVLSLSVCYSTAQRSQSFSTGCWISRQDSGPLFLCKKVKIWGSECEEEGMSGLRASILVPKSQNVRAWVCKRGHERTQGLNFVLKSKKKRAWASEKRAWGSLTFQNYSGKSLLIFCTTGSEVRGPRSTRGWRCSPAAATEPASSSTPGLQNQIECNKFPFFWNSFLVRKSCGPAMLWFWLPLHFSPDDSLRARN